jgi:phage terminase large subunit
VELVEVHIPKAFKRITETSRIKVFWGGRGSGKSESVARYLLLSGKEECMNILCCREFQVSIKQSVHSLLAALIEQMQLSYFYNVLDTEIRGLNGTKFSFAGLKNNIANIKSMHNIKKCWCEEAQNLSENSINVLLPTIRAPNSEIIFTMNPMLPTDPAYVRFIVNPPKDSVVVKVNYDQNPFFPEVLEKERLDLLERDPVAYRNVWLGEPRQAVEGAIYSRELQQAQEEGRIGSVPYDPSKSVSTYWDIGEGDYMTIIMKQKVGLEHYIIDYIQDRHHKVPYYLQLLHDKKYTYDMHVLPHDADHDRADAEFNTKMQVIRSFPNCRVIVNNTYAGAVRDGIEAVRNIFPFLRFDKEKCADLLFSLAHYHYKVDPVTGKTYGQEPHHDYSDGPDALRAMAMSYRQGPSPKKTVQRERPSVIRRSGIR